MKSRNEGPSTFAPVSIVTKLKFEFYK